MGGAVVAAAVLRVVARGTGHFDAAATGFATNGCGDRSPDHDGFLSCFVARR